MNLTVLIDLFVEVHIVERRGAGALGDRGVGLVCETARGLVAQVATAVLVEALAPRLVRLPRILVDLRLVLNTVNFTSAFKFQTHFEWRLDPRKLRNFVLQPRMVLLGGESAQRVDHYEVILALLVFSIRPQRRSLVILSVYGVLLRSLIFRMLGNDLLRLLFGDNRRFPLYPRLPRHVAQSGDSLVLLV